jgi:multidrug resistance efflux pump
MTAAILVLIAECTVFWLVFFRLKLLRLTPTWVVIFVFIMAPVFVVFLIGLRFVTPVSANATIIQHTIQLIPRLPDPTPVTAVLVEENTVVKKDQPLFQFDRRPYEYQVQQIEAQLAAARQNVDVLRADVNIATQKALKAKVEWDFIAYQKEQFDKLAEQGAVRDEDIVQWRTRAASAAATKDEALGELERARLQYQSEIDGVNTSVANLEAQLRQALYYLDNTTLAAPEDGRIVNLQVRPGMVSGTRRVGGIAALIAEADRYLLATFYQENLKYVLPGQPVEVALDLYPGQIFAGKVHSIWRANGMGQFLPSDEIPKFGPSAPTIPQGQYAVKILLDDPNQSKFPIGAQGIAAIYTNGERGAWAALRKVSIRAHSWLNWLYPINF